MRRPNQRAELFWILAVFACCGLYYSQINPPVSSSAKNSPTPAISTEGQTSKFETPANRKLYTDLLRSSDAFGVRLWSDSCSVTFVAEYRTSQNPRYIVAAGTPPGKQVIVECGTLTLDQQRDVYADLAVLPEAPVDGRIKRPPGETLYLLRCPGGDSAMFLSSFARSDNTARALLRDFESTFVGQIFVKHGWDGKI